MAQQPKKKKKVWLRTLLISLTIIILMIPVVLYVYLAYDHFHIDDMRADYSFDAPYVGDAVYQADGDVRIPLAAEDIYWLIDAYKLMDLLDFSGVTCRKTAVEIGDSTLSVYANVLYREVLPLPLRVDLSVQTGDTLNVSVTNVYIGKWFKIPTETLEKLGVEKQYSISVEELLEDTQITSIVFENKKIIMTGPFLSEFSKEMKPDMTADTLLLYGANHDDAISVASSCYNVNDAEERGQIIRDYVSGATLPVDAMLRLLSFCDADSAARTINTLGTFRAHFFLPVTTEDVANCRRTDIESIANYNGKLETLLTAVREKYKALEIKLTRNAYEDTATGETLSIAALCPDFGLDDSQCHPMLLIATEPLKAPFTADLPLYSEIPKSPGLTLAMTRDYLRNDIGVMLTLPDGSIAMIYYASTGELVVQCLPQATAANQFDEYRVPKVLNLDLAIFATKRILHDAPDPDLSRYIVFLPRDIEEVWIEKTK